jgi:uncharacterized membrane protein YfcA
MGNLELWAFALAMLVTLLAGVVKGAVGFAMPVIMISVFGSFMSVELALAGLIVPTLLTNMSQATRQGWRAALASVVKFKVLISVLVVFIIMSAQLLPYISQRVMLALLGGPIIAFAITQLMGVQMALDLRNRNRAEWTAGIIGGLYGGVSGVWGPPVLVYLLSMGIEKREQVRVLGVIFMIGAAALLLAHAQSGVINAVSFPFSLALAVPAMSGVFLGYAIQDRLNTERFRYWTLVFLALTGLNLLRRAYFG